MMTNFLNHILKTKFINISFRYYGCGLVFPNAIESTKVLDFGSGAGRDCFVMSKLVGEEGFVTGIDMTEEQVYHFLVVLCVHLKI